MEKTVKKLKIEITIDNENNTIQWNGWHSYNRWIYWKVYRTRYSDFRALIDRLNDKINPKKECVK